jgi:hypothetical protein
MAASHPDNHFANKLNGVLSRRAILREQIRRHQQRKRIAESRSPQEGPYYWIPLPDGSWELMSWFVSDYGIDSTNHADVWRKSAAHYLAERWGLEQQVDRIQMIPYGVPRGRVSRGVGSIYINHGDDAPVPEEEMVRKVCREFNLTGILLRNPHKIKVARDNHELMSRYDRVTLKALLDTVASQT